MCERHPLDCLGHLTGCVAVVGSMNADYTVTTPRLPGPGETVTGGPLEILPGGKSGNQAAQAAKLGVHVDMFGALGTDRNAEFLARCLAEAGVNTDAITRVPGPSGTTMITVDEAGENTIVYSPGANGTLDVEWVESIRDRLEGAGVLGLCLETPIDVVVEAARIVHEAGGQVLLNNSPFNPDLPHDLVTPTDVLLINEHEASHMLGRDVDAETDPRDLVAPFGSLGFDRVILTLGAHGSIVIDRGRTARIEAIVITPRDTTGCGDAFMATILAGLASGHTLAEAAAMGAYVGAYAATRSGAQASYGTWEQVRAAFA
ncbi:MAG: ribokinase [Actinomycetaceae bacterium]|nr:ribokinase [Actinomycetaceae bacterium]